MLDGGVYHAAFGVIDEVQKSTLANPVFSFVSMPARAFTGP